MNSLMEYIVRVPLKWPNLHSNICIKRLLIVDSFEICHLECCHSGPWMNISKHLSNCRSMKYMVEISCMHMHYKVLLDWLIWHKTVFNFIIMSLWNFKLNLSTISKKLSSNIWFHLVYISKVNIQDYESWILHKKDVRSWK